MQFNENNNEKELEEEEAYQKLFTNLLPHLVEPAKVIDDNYRLSILKKEFAFNLKIKAIHSFEAIEFGCLNDQLKGFHFGFDEHAFGIGLCASDRTRNHDRIFVACEAESDLLVIRRSFRTRTAAAFAPSVHIKGTHELRGWLDPRRMRRAARE